MTRPYEHPATEQTQRKLKRGTIARMIEKGTISATGPEIQAAEEIGFCYLAATHGVGLAKGSVERLDRSQSDVEPIRLIEARKKRYLPWTKQSTKMAINVTIDIVVHQWTATDLDRRYRRREGTCKDILLWSLRRYALIAGWVSGKQAQEWWAIIDGSTAEGAAC